MRRSLVYLIMIIGMQSTYLDSGAKAAEPNGGRVFYLQYCSSCHGTEGKGNGPVAAFLVVKPTDLTELQRKNNGIFPLRSVMSSIDGSRNVRAHGDRDMPVWGEVFRKETEGAKYGETTALLKIKIIADYIATLQR